MTMLVTGASGFIGFHVARALVEQGLEVVLVDNHSRNPEDREFRSFIEQSGVEFQALDLTNISAWESLGDRFDTILHFAAINGTRHFYERPYDVVQTNIDLVGSLLKWHRRLRSKSRIIWTSSAEVYGGLSDVAIPTPETTPVGFEDVTNARFSYGGSKLAGEILMTNYGRTANTRFTIVRPHNIYGPRMGHDHVVPEFIGRILRCEDPFVIKGGEQTRAFCYVGDLVDGITSLLRSDQLDGEIVHIGNDAEETRITRVAELLFDIAGVAPKLQIDPAPAGSAMRRQPNIDKARKALGYSPRVDLREGLERSYNWYARENTR